MSSTEIVDGLALVSGTSSGIDAIYADRSAKRQDDLAARGVDKATRVPADRDVASDRTTEPNLLASTRLTGAAATEWDEWKSVRDVGLS